MKRPVKLSLAVALALAGGNAFALGLGAIQVKSGLNQPLDAEIPVTSDTPAEVNGLNVDLASAEDFARIGLNRSRISVPIDMSVGTNARGQTVIKLTTKEPVREPLLDFLLVANWANGKLLREYTVLLDPPITAPAKATATVAPIAEKQAAAPKPLPENRPAPVAPPPKPVREPAKPPVATTAPPKPEPKPVVAPPPKLAAAPAATGNDYGPVAQGETLSEIARATRPDDKTSVDQMMLALLKSNPKAFYQDNINALKRGAILRIPSGDELRANGTMREAAEQVRNQNDAWSGKAPVSTPTLVAHTGTSTKAGPDAGPKADTKAAKQERLALVPPSKDKNDASADRAGAAGGTGKDNAAVKAELARTKEALASREQEASELKSRVKQLEDIGSKDQRLISMKDSEIADLQKKLKDLQAKANAPVAAATAKPAEAPKPAEPAAKPSDSAATKAAETAAATAKPDQKITAKDIWGDMASGDKGATKPVTGSSPTTTGTPSTPTAGSSAATTTPTTTPTAPAPAPTPSPSTAAATPASAASATDTTSPAASSPTPPTATVAATPTGTEASPAGPTAAVPTPAAESSTKPIKPSPPAKVTPLAPAAEPFWKNQNVLLGGGAALLLVGLLALTRFMRKPKGALVTGAALDDTGAGVMADDEELRLRDALQQNPGNTSASLELLRHYYSMGDAVKFEAAAESMHAHLADPGAPEWDEVLAMGAVLAPNHPLFSDVAAHGMVHEHALHEAHHDAEAVAEHEQFAYPAHEEHVHETLADEARTHIGRFDELGPELAAAAPEVPVHHDEAFDFDLPLQTEETPPEDVVVHHAAAAEPVVEHVAEPAPSSERLDDIYVGEDAIGTKLDLAKAYLDMGDPEGAKSMLDEVLAEGNDSQQEEARRLLAEIR